MKLSELLSLLDETPVIADIHPISCYYLPEDIWITDSLADVVWEMDEPDQTLPRRILITKLDKAYKGRFPYVRVEHNPFSQAFNEILSHRFDDIASHMLTQSKIAHYIISDSENAEVIILYLVDGLSYLRVQETFTHWPFESWAACTVYYALHPCLVDSPTVTHIAFPNLIGYPPLAMRLFEKGFSTRLGFSYWSRSDNLLTNRIFHGIPCVKRITDFGELIEYLRNYIQFEKRTFIQILRSGLDDYAHHQKRRPPIEAVVADIQREFIELIALFCEIGRPAHLYLSSDHGILWRWEFEPQVIGNAPSRVNPRFGKWQDLASNSGLSYHFVIDREEYLCLNYPQLRRPLRIDEQGVHGGISFQESIVPFISVSICPSG